METVGSAWHFWVWCTAGKSLWVRNAQGRFGLISTNTRAHMSYCLFFNPLLKVLVLAGLMAKPYDLQNVFFKCGNNPSRYRDKVVAHTWLSWCLIRLYNYSFYCVDILNQLVNGVDTNQQHTTGGSPPCILFCCWLLLRSFKLSVVKLNKHMIDILWYPLPTKCIPYLVPCSTPKLGFQYWSSY